MDDAAAFPNRIVPAVDRAARVFAFLESEKKPLGISDLARRLEASKGSVRDLLETLRTHGLLERDEQSKQYRLGAGLVRLGNAAAGQLDLAAVARPLMTDLAEATGETVLLFTRQGERALIAEKAEAAQATMRVSAQVGRRIPLVAGAGGKIFLAWADRCTQENLLGNLPRYTDNTIVDRTAYEAELRAVRRLGYALDDCEYLDGVRAVAAPIFDARGALCASLVAVGLSGSLTAERLRPVAETTARAAESISAALGAPRNAGG